MNYNDFPILNDEEYFLIQAQYESLPWNRNEKVYAIFLTLQQSLNMCYAIKENFNNKIKSALNQSKQIVEKILYNLSNVFNFKSTNLSVPSEFNIFTLTKKMVEASKQFEDWRLNEKKEYYKKIAHSCILDLLSTVNVILNSMEASFN